jgi:hypothetical protein
MLRFSRRIAFATSVIALTLPMLALTPAQAGLIASGCGSREVSQPFLPWLDPGHYFLMTGGGVETASGWTFAGGARVVDGNEPFYAHSSSDSHSLLLGTGAWAQTPSACVDFTEPTMRFFVRNNGSPLTALVVEARLQTTLLGWTTQTTLPLGVVLGTTKSWQPSLPVVFALSLNQLLGGKTTIAFRFTAIGAGGEWQVDDVYVDPFKDRSAS